MPRKADRACTVQMYRRCGRREPYGVHKGKCRGRKHRHNGRLAGLFTIGGLEGLRPREKTDSRQWACLLYTSDAADDLLCVDLGGRRIIKKKKKKLHNHQ